MGAENVKVRIKSGDMVVVTTGKDKGKIGKVLRVLPSDGKVVVEGVRRVKRHVKPAQDRPGGIVEKEAPLPVSNVAFWDVARQVRVKIGYRTLEDGRKVRVDRKTGSPLDQ